MKRLLTILVTASFVFTVKAQDIRYTVCDQCWQEDLLGNHRVEVVYKGTGTVAHVVIPWRRRDDHPQDKRIIVQDGATGRNIRNVQTGTVDHEKGELWFEAVSGKGIYYIYYMPFKNTGSANYPTSVYLAPESLAGGSWLSRLNKTIPVNTTVQSIQAIDSLNSFYPMEVIATEEETNSIRQQNSGKAMVVFPEDREYSIRMKDRLPYRWVKNGTSSTFKGIAARGEFYTYQLGIYALQNLEEVQVVFTDLVADDGRRIDKSVISCINTTGTTYDARPFRQQVTVPATQVQAMWCAINIPPQTASGIYTGTATVQAKGQTPVPVTIQLTVTNEVKQDGGISEPWKMTRLHWLNSTMAQENTVIAPYTPLKVKKHTIALLGRKLVLGADGLPAQVQTFFTPEMTALTTTPTNILTAPIQWIAEQKGQPLEWKQGGVQFISKDAGTVKWKSTSHNAQLEMDVNGTIEFDGFVSYQVKITALTETSLDNTHLLISFNKEAATYMMGLGQKGGYRPDDFTWTWDVAHKNQDGAWIGAVNAGMQYSLRDERYVRPLNTNFYLQKPLLLPTSWGNDNKGGIHIREQGDVVTADNYSGARVMKKGDILYYNFTLLITPFHPINTDFQWATRFYHKYNNLDTIKATGATVVNIHHATPINPWINYPFIEHAKMKAYIDEAHEKGLKVKIYNTIRELSNHAYETFALRSLGHEIYSPGKGGGYSWLQEHIDSDYIAAWFVPEIKDAAIVNSGMSRWHNYYVEGMNWLVQQVGIDGIYLDDVAFDRVTMKRIKRVLTQDGHPGIIDLHSANQYNKSDGFNNSANLYMEHFPYLNRLWFGEYFDYENNNPDFFLTEVSGIPFGLMGEMLQGGGNPWRGMVYGMTNRMPWSDNADPRPIWKLWDDFGMEGTSMIGYWSGHCPVKTDNDRVPVTVYKKKGAVLVAIASWAAADTTVQMSIDWKALGIDPSRATITAPAVRNFQPTRTIAINNGVPEALPIEKGKGWMLVIK